jgi:rhamnulokinase
MQTCYLAVDIGASSGRHIIGTVEHGVMALHEVYRFENRLIEKMQFQAFPEKRKSPRP